MLGTLGLTIEQLEYLCYSNNIPTETLMTQIRIIRNYPHPPSMVWRAITDPKLVARWTVTGQGGRPVGFTPIVGSKFQLVVQPVPGWRGVVYCEVLEVDDQRLLRYTWRGE